MTDYGVHLPLIDLDGQRWSLRRLLEYAETAESLGFRALSANDHLFCSRPWLDGPTALGVTAAQPREGIRHFGAMLAASVPAASVVTLMRSGAVEDKGK